VNGNELLRKLRRLARRLNVEFAFDPTGGKGGHGYIVFGDRRTILRSSRHKEIPSGSLRGMLSDLGIDPRELG
jgi:mRNA interferase HicA